MPVVVGIRFRGRGKIYYFDPNGFTIIPGDKVIVETIRGTELGTAVLGPRDVPESKLVQPLKKVLRLATEEDVAVEERNRERAVQALDTAKAKAREHGLDMNFLDAEFTFDGTKVILYFSAEGRIDFRELVKDLAAALRTRVELRQIGVRDEAKLIGGIGPCGRVLCCVTFLNEFLPVSIKMAKDQNLSLNPTKISGTCGRLLCCLRFECEHYEDARSSLPTIGTTVLTPEGEGKVIAQNPIKSTITVELDGGKSAEFPVEEVEEKKSERA